MSAMGSMYAAVIFLGIQNASAVQPVVDIERTVFYRERAAGMYSALPYAFAQVTSLAVVHFICYRSKLTSFIVQVYDVASSTYIRTEVYRFNHVNY